LDEGLQESYILINATFHPTAGPTRKFMYSLYTRYNRLPNRFLKAFDDRPQFAGIQIFLYVVDGRRRTLIAIERGENGSYETFILYEVS
jgi:hypothetical protein